MGRRQRWRDRSKTVVQPPLFSGVMPALLVWEKFLCTLTVILHGGGTLGAPGGGVIWNRCQLIQGGGRDRNHVLPPEAPPWSQSCNRFDVMLRTASEKTSFPWWSCLWSLGDHMTPAGQSGFGFSEGTSGLLRLLSNTLEVRFSFFY